MVMKRRMSIEKALQWAYREELGKAPLGTAEMAGMGMRAGSGPVTGWAADGSPHQVSDCVNRFGVLAIRDPFNEVPHDDALRIGEAVQCVDREVRGWQITSLAPTVQDAQAARLWQEVAQRAEQRVATSFERLIRMRSLSGDRQEWQDIEPRLMEVRNTQGGPRWFRMVDVVQRHDEADGSGPVAVRMEVDGFDARRRRPFPNAYRKYALDPDPVWMLVARAEHAVWCAGLDAVFDELTGSNAAPLRTINLEPRATLDAPWMRTAGKVAVLRPDKKRKKGD
jgi:hypothetical protein